MTKPKSTASATKAQPVAAVPAPRRSRPRAAKSPAEPPAPPAPTTKLETLAGLLTRKQGASVEALMAATGWQPHSVRGALAGAMRKRFGAKVTSEVVNGVRIYHAPKP